MILKEGGNVFKDGDGQPLTQRIQKAYVDPTIGWVENLTGIPHKDFKLGTTGRKPTSGDIDIAVDASKHDKKELAAKLKAWAQKAHPEDNPRQWVAMSGTSVHVRAPINGDDSNGFVQVDLMFGDPKWMDFTHAGSSREDSQFKGSHRAILISSIAKANGLKWSPKLGLVSRASNEVVSKDPDRIAEILLGPGSERSDLADVETIIAKIKRLPNYDELVADAKDNFARDGLTLPEATQFGSREWFREMVDMLK